MTQSPDNKQSLRELVQHIEIQSSLAMHRSMQDGDPKHHSKMIADSVAMIESHIQAARIENTAKELDRLEMEYGIAGSKFSVAKYLEIRRGQLRKEREALWVASKSGYLVWLAFVSL